MAIFSDMPQELLILLWRPESFSQLLFITAGVPSHGSNAHKKLIKLSVCVCVWPVDGGEEKMEQRVRRLGKRLVERGSVAKQKMEIEIEIEIEIERGVTITIKWV